MMGERTMMQEALFYGFSLERHVPRWEAAWHLPAVVSAIVTWQTGSGLPSRTTTLTLAGSALRSVLSRTISAAVCAASKRAA